MVLKRAALVLLILFAYIYIKNYRKRDQMRQKLMEKWMDPKNDVMYVIGDQNFIRTDEEADRYLLHVAEVIQPVKKNELKVVDVPFPYNGQDHIIKLVRVVNFNSKYTNEELKRKPDEDFWIKVSEGDIDTNSITLQINSRYNLFVDVEFYGTNAFNKDPPINEL